MENLKKENLQIKDDLKKTENGKPISQQTTAAGAKNSTAVTIARKNEQGDGPDNTIPKRNPMLLPGLFDLSNI